MSPCVFLVNETTYLKDFIADSNWYLNFIALFNCHYINSSVEENGNNQGNDQIHKNHNEGPINQLEASGPDRNCTNQTDENHNGSPRNDYASRPRN
jgi:hypothetical protein